MREVLLLLELLTCVALSSAGSKHQSSSYHSQYPKHPPPSAYEGTPCEVPNGYLPYTCEAGTLMHSWYEVLPVEIHGSVCNGDMHAYQYGHVPIHTCMLSFNSPNVCRLTEVFLAREEEYVFQQQCVWEYDYHQHTYFYLCL